MSDRIKVMLVDDHIMFRQGLRQLLESDEKVVVVDEAGDGEECINKLDCTEADIILLDISMPVKNGIEVLKKIKSNNRNIKVLILTAHDELQYLVTAISNGAAGYILKSSGIYELKKAIYMIMNGEEYIRPDLFHKLYSNLDDNLLKMNQINFLTKREQEVLIKVANGMSNKEIGNTLNISERTVKNHLSNIFKKIKVSDRTQAALYAIKNNIIIV